MGIARNLYVCLMFVIITFTLVFNGAAMASEHQPEIVYSPIGSGQLSDIAITLDSLNQPHMLFTESLSNGPLPKRLLYAKRVAGQWQVQTVATGPLFNGLNGLAIDDSGRPHIAVMDVETRNVMHGVLDAGSWTFDTVALAASWYTPAIQLDDQNNPLIAYASSITFGRPELAIRSSSGLWENRPSLVPNSLLYDSGALDLELDGSGVPYISYMGLSGFGQPSFISVVSPDPDFGGAMVAQRVVDASQNDITYVTADLEISNISELRLTSTTTGAIGKISLHTLTNGVWGETLLNSRRPVFTNPAALAIDDLGQSRILHTRIHPNIGSSFLGLTTIGPSGNEVELLESHSTGGGSAWLSGMEIDDADGIHIAYTTELSRGISYLFIPEPTSLILVAVGGLTLLRRRKVVDCLNGR